MTEDIARWEAEGGYAPPDPDTFADTAEAVGALVVTRYEVREVVRGLMMREEMGQ